VVAAALGLILIPDLGVLSRDAAIAAGSGFLGGFLAGLFPAAAGLPLLVLAGVATLLGASVVSGLTPVRTRMELVRASVLSIRDSQITVEISDPAREAALPEVLTLPEPQIAARVSVLDLPSGLFLLGARRFAAYQVGGEGSALEPSGLLQRTLEYGWWKVDELEARTTQLNLLESYELRVGPDLAPTFVLVTN
jgi:hypothetical protein